MSPRATPHDLARDTPPTGPSGRLLDGLAALVRLVPLRLADVLAWTAAWFWWYILPIRRRTAVENLRLALPGVAVRPTLLRMMHDLVLGYLELLQWRRVTVEIEGSEHLSGSIVVGGHGGAWDLALLACARAAPVSIFLRTPKSRWVQAWLARLRDENGVHRLETGATMRDGYAALAAGRAVFFIQDQRHNQGPRLDFFGRSAHTSLGAAVASLKTGARVVGAWPSRAGVGRHRVRCEPIELVGSEMERTVQLNAWYAARIAEHPHGWLWLHNRWR